MEQNPNRPTPNRKQNGSVSKPEAESEVKTKKEKKRRELTHKTIVVRSRTVLVLMLAALVALCGRLAFLQIVDPYDYAQQAVEQYTYEVKLEAKRGTIYAADGTTKLASSVTTFAMMEKMDKKGVLLNSAFAISAAFVFADHLAFTMAFNSAYVVPVTIAKLAGGVTALIVGCLLYSRLYRKEEQAYGK